MLCYSISFLPAYLCFVGYPINLWHGSHGKRFYRKAAHKPIHNLKEENEQKKNQQQNVISSVTMARLLAFCHRHDA